MKNLAKFSPKIAIFFKFTLGFFLKHPIFSFIFLGPKKRVFRQLKKKEKKIKGKERKKERPQEIPKYFLIICDIVALPIMT